MNPRLRSVILPMTAVIVGAIVAGNATAAKAPLATDQMVSAKRGNQCTPWTQALPPLPKTCAAPPTLAQCSDGAFYKTPCGKEPAVRDAYCQKLHVDHFCGTDKSTEELVHPVANYKQTPISAIAGQPTSLFIPPGLTMGGRQVAYVPRGDLGDKPPPANAQAGQLPLSQTGGVTGIQVRSAGMGTYMSSTMTKQVAHYNQVRATHANLQLGVLASRAAGNENDALFTLLAADADQWVGDGTDTPQHRAVDSCAEYTFQRWYDYTHFKNEARALGRNYRGVYHLAIDPKSPVWLEKGQLKQFAVGNLPSAWPPAAYHDPTTDVPRNPFWSVPSFAPDVSGATQNAITTRIKNLVQNKGHYITLPGGTHSRMELHKRLRAELEQNWHPSDDALDERQARQDRYAELLAARQELQGPLLCAIAPKACCGWQPVAGGSKQDELLAKIRGSAYINPDPNQISSIGAYTGEFNSYDKFRGADQLGLGGSATMVKGIKGANGQAIGGMKQKAPPPAGRQLQSMAVPGASGAVSPTPSGQTCEQEYASQLPRLQAAMAAVVRQLSDLVVKEFSIPDGCLEDPGTHLGNSCDWSYEKFAHFAMTYFDEAVENDFKACGAAVGGSFTKARDPNKQGNIWPCEVRHDFGADQLDVAYFVDQSQQTRSHKFCEQERAQEKVDEYLKQNAAIVKRIPVDGNGIGEASSDQWELGSRDSLGAYMQYGVGWHLYGGMGNQKDSDGAWCHPAGDGSMSAGAGFYFFGSDVKVIDAGISGKTTDDKVYYGAHFAYRDLTELSSVKLKQAVNPPVPDGTLAPGSPMIVPMGLPHVLGDIGYGFWVQIGPIPLHIQFGANASTGVDLAVLGHPTAKTSCDNKAVSIEKKKLDFSAGGDFVPWVRGDAYADASIDVVIAAAGVRLDLLLLKISLPTGTTVAADTGETVKLDTGSTLAVDALEGRVSAYVRVGVSPLSYTWEVTLFSWDGLHTATPLWGTHDQFPLKLATWAAQPKVTPNDVYCLKYQSPDKSQNFAGHPYCLKNPTIAEDKKQNACAVPYKWPSNIWSSGYCNAQSYQLRAPLQ